MLKAWNDGDAAALERLTPIVYAELHRLARRNFAGEREGRFCGSARISRVPAVFPPIFHVAVDVRSCSRNQSLLRCAQHGLRWLVLTEIANAGLPIRNGAGRLPVTEGPASRKDFQSLFGNQTRKLSIREHPRFGPPRRFL
jgi:hypothetical protein